MGYKGIVTWAERSVNCIDVSSSLMDFRVESKTEHHASLSARFAIKYIACPIARSEYMMGLKRNGSKIDRALSICPVRSYDSARLSDKRTVNALISVPEKLR